MALVKTNVAADTRNDFSFLHPSKPVADFVICKSPDKLQLLIDAIKTNEQVHFVSDGDWSLHDLVMSLIPLCGSAVELYLTTYAIREFPVRQLILAQERGDIKRVVMLLDYRAKVRTPEVFQLAKMNVDSIYLTSIHAKVTVIRAKDCCFTIVGSANWTQNPRIEVGLIRKAEADAVFHIEWIEKIMNDAELFN